MKFKIKFIKPLISTIPNPDAPDHTAGVPLGTRELKRPVFAFPRGIDGRPGLKNYQIRGYLMGVLEQLVYVDPELRASVEGYGRHVGGPGLTVTQATDHLRDCIRKSVYVFPEHVAFSRKTVGKQVVSSKHGKVAIPVLAEVMLEGAAIEPEIKCQDPELYPLIQWILEYGNRFGMGMKREEGYGTFECKEVA